MKKTHILFAAVLAVAPVSATDYMTREQLNSAVVYDLPGVLPPDMRERNPEYMTMNAFSRASDALSSHSTLTLGLVGGIGALGLAGVLSAPVAIIAAAAVGGFALVGALSDNDRETDLRGGRASANFGSYGTGGAPNVGASRDVREQGLLGQIFGLSTDRGEYGVGSIGLSSSQRAPVHVNMQNPHVLNVASRGYNFASYDQNYHQGYSNMYGMGVSPYQNPMVMQHAMIQQAQGPIVSDRAYGLPYSPQSSNLNGPASAQTSVQNGFIDGVGFYTSQTRVTYVPPQANQNPWQQNTWGNGSMVPGSYPGAFPGSYPGSMPHQAGMYGMPPMMHYGMQMVYPNYQPARQTGEQFTSFFERTTPPGGNQESPRGTRADLSNNMPWYMQTQYNWMSSVGRPDNMLALSGEYQGANSWNQTSPQGRVTLPVQQYDMAPAMQYNTGQAYTNQNLPQGYSVPMQQTYSYPYGMQAGNYSLPPQIGLGQTAVTQQTVPVTSSMPEAANLQARKAALEQERRDVYQKLTEAIQNGDATGRQSLTDRYNQIDQELRSLQ